MFQMDRNSSTSYAAPMPVPGSATAPALDRSRGAVIAAATRLLLESPHLSLGDLAVRIGIGRTTLHRMFPTRQALLAAIAHDALDHLAEVYAEAGLGAVTAPRGTAKAVRATAIAPLARLIESMIPLGSRLMFLVRAAELQAEPEIDRRLQELDRPLRQTIEAAQRAGALATDTPSWWMVESLYALIYIGWEQIERGRLAARDAAPLVLRSWLGGMAGGPVRR